MHRPWLAGVALATLMGTPSFAQPVTAPSVYSNCDGYGAPSRAGDGMTSQALSLGIFVPGPTSGTTLRTDLALTDDGRAACDAALAALPAKYWLRKVNLLQARAMHKIGSGDKPGGLADLDLARGAALEPDDPYLRRSLLLNADFIRAYVVRDQGDRKTGATMAAQAWAQRPYNRQSGYAALAAMGGATDAPEVSVVMRGLALIQPDASNFYFWRLIEERRFAEAAAVYPAGSEILLRRFGMVGKEPGIRTAAAYAYALAATGRADEARKVLHGAQARLDELVAGGPSASQAYGQITMQAESEGLKEWALLISRRLDVSDGKVAAVLEGMRSERIPNTPIAIDLLDAILAKLPTDYADAKAPLESLKSQLKPSWEDAPGELAELFRDLPDAETEDRVARFGRKANFFFGDIDAYKLDRHDDGSVTVSYRGLEASGAIVEEFALLHAAHLARKEGKRGFIVLERRDYQHTMTNTYYGVPVATFHNGYGTELDLLFVNPEALPAGYEQLAWRVIDADEVYRTLGPIYHAPVQVSGR